MHFQKELELLLKSSCSLIYILNYEEERLEYFLKNIINNDVSQAIYFWDFVDGYKSSVKIVESSQRNPMQALQFIESFSASSDAIFVLRDFHLFFNDIAVVRKIRNLSRKLDVSNQSLIISSSELNIPKLLQYIITVIELPLPSKYEIKVELLRLISLLDQPVNSKLLDDLLVACQGLSLSQIRIIFSRIMIENQYLDSSSIEYVLQEKRKEIKNNGFLELSSNTIPLNHIGGINLLKEWLQKRASAFSSLSINYGLPYPKGILLVGIQGTGKSMSAQAIAHEFQLTLLKLDIGKLFAGVVGESESNVRQMIQISEASAPCVLWIDEIDKVFDKNRNSGDSGTTSRVLATLLNWLAEKTTPVFVVATANNITSLPSEIIRKGRFDEIFFIDLPNQDEREKIFQVHLKKLRPNTWHRYNISYLAKYSDLFSGAEIQQVIFDAMYSAFNQKREFTSEDILRSIILLVPLAFTDQMNIRQLQAWARLGKSRLASTLSL